MEPFDDDEEEEEDDIEGIKFIALFIVLCMPPKDMGKFMEDDEEDGEGMKLPSPYDMGYMVGKGPWEGGKNRICW